MNIKQTIMGFSIKAVVVVGLHIKIWLMNLIESSKVLTRWVGTNKDVQKRKKKDHSHK